MIRGYWAAMIVIVLLAFLADRSEGWQTFISYFASAAFGGLLVWTVFQKR